MTRTEWIVLRWALASFLVIGVIPVAAWAGDVSRYRKFQFGTAADCRQTGAREPVTSKTIRIAAEDATERAKAEQARLVNRPKFLP